MLSSSKCKGLLNNRKKPAKLMWTQAWRRLHKKGKDEGVARKKARRVVKAARAIVGASLEEVWFYLIHSPVTLHKHTLQ